MRRHGTARPGLRRAAAVSRRRGGAAGPTRAQRFNPLRAGPAPPRAAWSAPALRGRPGEAPALDLRATACAELPSRAAEHPTRVKPRPALRNTRHRSEPSQHAFRCWLNAFHITLRPHGPLSPHGLPEGCSPSHLGRLQLNCLKREPHVGLQLQSRSSSKNEPALLASRGQMCLTPHTGPWLLTHGRGPAVSSDRTGQTMNANERGKNSRYSTSGDLFPACFQINVYIVF